MVAWEGLWMKGERVRVASLWEGVRVHVVLCWLQLMLQLVLLVAGWEAQWREWLNPLVSQQQEDVSSDASLAWVVEMSLGVGVGVVLACL